MGVISCSMPDNPNLQQSETGGDLTSAAISPVIALYGFSRNSDWFSGKSDAEILDILNSWNVNAVFGVHEEPELAGVLRQGGIKIFAEFSVFAGEQYWDRFPASRPVTSEGLLLEKEEWYAGVNPSNAQVRKEKLADFREMLETYSLDGIWLDFIRWPCHWEVKNPRLEATSFDQATIREFCLESSLRLDSEDDPVRAAKLIQDRYREEWYRWRCDQVTSWVAESRKIIDNCSPGTKLGLFGVPWIRDYDNAIISVIGQDYEALGKHVDIFSPMAYHLMCGRPVSWVGDVTEKIGKITGRVVLPIIQTVNTPGSLSPEELGNAVQSALESTGSMGVIFYNLDGLDEKKLEVSREVIYQLFQDNPGSSGD